MGILVEECDNAKKSAEGKSQRGRPPKIKLKTAVQSSNEVVTEISETKEKTKAVVSRKKGRPSKK